MSRFDRLAKSVLHPTDFSRTSESAFAHALAIAIRNRAELTIFHVVEDMEDEVRWHDYPSVRETLQRWGYLDEGAPRRHVAKKLGIKVKKAVGYDSDVRSSIIEMAAVNEFDLVVMATQRERENLFQSQSDVAVPVSQKTHLPTLFVPQGARGCVSLQDGRATLSQILIPVARKPDAQPVIDRIVIALNNFGAQNAQITMLHVGSKDWFPVVNAVDDGNFTWSNVTRNGDVADEIVATAEELNADVIAMVTEGKKGFWDAIRGNTVQQVLKKAPCPVFAIPAGF